jgi:hypothetical protein
MYGHRDTWLAPGHAHARQRFMISAIAAALRYE